MRDNVTEIYGPDGKTLGLWLLTVPEHDVFRVFRSEAEAMDYADLVAEAVLRVSP